MPDLSRVRRRPWVALPALAVLAGTLAWAALVLPLAETAKAADVRVDQLPWGKYGGPPPGYAERLSVRALEGEANRITLSRGPAGEIQIADSGARLRVGAGCVALGPRSVSCAPTSPYFSIFVLAGDGGDVVASSVAAKINGGPGDDRLSGSGLADVLYGGEGRDVLRGQGGDDLLQDGRLRRMTVPGPFDPGVAPPDEPVASADAERDVFDGGSGADLVSYSSRRRGVAVDLSRRDRHAGARGEYDLLRAVEGVVGGDGDDRLLGDRAANRLLGGAGDDFADGRAGDDHIDLGVGSNRARGGPGDDTIAVMWGDTPQPLVQRVSCGTGRDRVSQLFRNDYAEDDCETVVIAEFHELQALLPPASWDRPPLASYSTSPTDCEGPSCRLELDARLARSPNRRLPRLKGLLVGQATTTVTYRAVTSLTLNLSDRGARLLRRYRELLIRIRLNIVREDHPEFVTEGQYITRLRAPARFP
jgi:Ca2+-binding RTX toxin-like protein